MRADLVVVGGGVMGLFTAFHASARGHRVVVLERGRIGDPATASFGRTRSYRNDYLDPAYARLAHEAHDLWGDFERATGTRALVRCGCMNIAKRSVTPELDRTYAERSHRVLEDLGLPTETLRGDALRTRFPDLDADVGHIDLDAGVVDLAAVTAALMRTLAARGVDVREGVEPLAIEEERGGVRVRTNAGVVAGRALVVTAGHGTNDVAARLEGCEWRAPITRDRPTEAKYVAPPAEIRNRFTADAMPVVAYLDAGIYVHPIVEGVVDEVKIGYYDPPDLPRGTTSIGSVAEFVEECLPVLRGAPIRDVRDYDGCYYDLVADDDFVLGAIPRTARAFVGVGWRGTGYKFAPWVGRVLAELALQHGTVYDVRRFDPARFQEGEPREPLVAEPATPTR